MLIYVTVIPGYQKVDTSIARHIASPMADSPNQTVMGSGRQAFKSCEL